MKTITIDIIDSKAIRLLRDLEQLQLIRMREESTPPPATTKWAVKYKGIMTKQSLTDVDNQLNELRNGWE